MGGIDLAEGAARLERLRARRLAEDERLVCIERARILDAGRNRHAHLPRAGRQAAILRDLCERITPVIEEEDVLAGRMPEVVPTAAEESWIGEHPELFVAPGVPGWLDSLSIYVPDWDALLRLGLGGIAAQAQRHLDALTPTHAQGAAPATEAATLQARREFLAAAIEAPHAVSCLIRRYAAEARRQASASGSPARRRELEGIAARCDHVAWDAPAGFIEALQLLQIVHMVLACLVGGRDVTPGRIDQYLLPFYQRDLAAGRLCPDEAAVLLAMFLLRLTQMAGNGTDYDDNLRRSPCRYSHLYATVGGVDAEGRPALNPLSFVLVDAIRRLRYKEPTLLVRCTAGMDREFLSQVAALIRLRLPVTIYHDEVVTAALIRQGVSPADARGYGHSACHHVVVVGQEAGTGVGGFHNLPQLVLRALARAAEGDRTSALSPEASSQCPRPDPTNAAPGNAADSSTLPRSPAAVPQSNSGGGAAAEEFEAFCALLREEVRALLAGARRTWERHWEEEYRHACPLLASCLMPESLAQGRPCWQAAPVSHLNHYLMGLGTAVDSLLALRALVFAEGRLSLGDFAAVLAADWSGHEALRREVRGRLPRYGQGCPEARALAAGLGRMWVEEVESASRGMSRLQLWPGFYSHMLHVPEGRRTPATPDGRQAGEPLSENVGPSFATPRCSPTSILEDMAALPFDHTPSGAASLALSLADFQGEHGTARLLALIEGYFRMGGLHLQINVLEAHDLEAAMAAPEEHADLMVRVTGFSAYFTRLSRDVQEDLVRRCRRDGS